MLLIIRFSPISTYVTVTCSPGFNSVSTPRLRPDSPSNTVLGADESRVSTA